ncbi:lipopolysaccharide biosynthesis protein [Enterococcus sp. LJL90]
MENKRLKKLANNSIVFAVGNLGSKFMSFIMLPLYTWKLSQSDLGVSDLIITTVSLLLPIMSLSIFDAVLRFAMEKDINYESVYSNSLVVTFGGTIVIFLMFVLGTIFRVSYIGFICLIVGIQIFQTLFSQYAKAIGKVKLFAINGILVSILTAGFNLILLVFVEWGLFGYLASILLANLVSTIWLFCSLHLSSSFKWSLVRRNTIVSMLTYSMPLIPNSIAWWSTNALSRYFILFFSGASANGIYAIANKIPNLINVFNSIFFQAWQLSAIEEYSSQDRAIFYSKIFSMYSQFMLLATSFVILVIKPILSFLVSSEFYIAWKYVPLLLLAIVYSSFSSFLGNFYAAAMETKNAFTTTIYGAVISLILNGIFIPLFGLYGAGLSSTLSFFFLWLIRQRSTKRYAEIKVDKSNMIINHAIIFVQIACLYFFTTLQGFFFSLVCFILLLFVNKALIKSFFEVLKNKFG